MTKTPSRTPAFKPRRGLNPLGRATSALAFREIPRPQAAARAEAAAAAKIAEEAKAKKRYDCRCCRDRFELQTLALLKCRHCYCGDCLTYLFEQAVTNEASFPPRCCDPISLTYVRERKLISKDLADRYAKKRIEYSTPANTRVYCANTKCANFIGVANAGKAIARCGACGQKTCVRCKKSEHIAKGCSEDEATKQAKELMKKKGWKICKNCGEGIERRSGCNHMRCKCGFNFCYLCGLKWRRCTCDMFENTEYPNELSEISGARRGRGHRQGRWDDEQEWTGWVGRTERQLQGQRRRGSLRTRLGR